MKVPGAHNGSRAHGAFGAFGAKAAGSARTERADVHETRIRCGARADAYLRPGALAHARSSSALRAAACLMFAILLAIGCCPAWPLLAGQLAFADDASQSSASADTQAHEADEPGGSEDEQESSDGAEKAEGDSASPGASGGGGPSGDSDGKGSERAQDPKASGGNDEVPADSPGTSGGEGAGGNVTGAEDGPDSPGDDAQPVEPTAPQEDSASPPDSAAPSEPEAYYVQMLLLKWDEPDENDVTHFVGDAPIVEKAYRQVKVSEYGKTVQLRGWYLSTDGTGVAYQTADSTTTIGNFNLKWQSSDESIATVAPDGLVTPHGKNGEVVITATVDDEHVYLGEAPAATVTLVFDAQEGKYVKRVEILDESGNNIGEKWGGVTVFNDENAFHQLHARVTWHNVETGEETVETTGTGEDYDASKVGTTITWNVSASNAFSINEDTGRLRTTAYSGNAYVTCSAVGGLEGVVVQDTANVQLDTGTYEYNPADSLTLRVVWEERPDEVVKEQTFSLDDLAAALSLERHNYTVVNNSRFGVISAEGYLFKDVVALVAVDDGDVLQYRFGTADGYDNPVSYKYLFESGNRYYFPNYDIGSSAAGEIVPPLLAVRSTFAWNQSEANPTWELDEGTRFRLVFGCLASGDANTSFQIYYIDTITIVLAGAPSAGDDPSGTAKPGDDRVVPVDDSTVPEDAPPIPGKEAVGTGDSGGGSKGLHEGVDGSGGNRSPGNLAGRDGDGRRRSGAVRTDDEKSETVQGDDAPQDPDDAQDEGLDDGAVQASASKRWRVYQMMNKTNSDVPDWDDENPISPYAAPLAAATFAAGMGVTGVGFWRRLR